MRPPKPWQGHAALQLSADRPLSNCGNIDKQPCSLARLGHGPSRAPRLPAPSAPAPGAVGNSAQSSRSRAPPAPAPPPGPTLAPEYHFPRDALDWTISFWGRGSRLISRGRGSHLRASSKWAAFRSFSQERPGRATVTAVDFRWRRLGMDPSPGAWLGSAAVAGGRWRCWQRLGAGALCASHGGSHSPAQRTTKKREAWEGRELQEGNNAVGAKLVSSERVACG